MKQQRRLLMMVCAPALAASVAIAACSEPAPRTQVVTGQVSARDAVAVRAVDGENVVTAAQVRSDGGFSLALPAGKQYRVEVLTRTGVKHLYSYDAKGLHDLSFKVCAPGAPWNIGTVQPPGSGTGGGGSGHADGCDPAKDPGCKCAVDGSCTGGGGGSGSGSGCYPGEPNCGGDPGCDPTKDPTCGGGGGSGSGSGCYPGEPNCGGVPGCDPTTDPCKCDPTCGGGGGSGSGSGCYPGEPSCGSPGCDPATDPCKCDPLCGKPVCPPDDPTCSSCDPAGTACPPPVPPPCDDPADPTSCKDPCQYEPATCGCAPDQPGCWAEPGVPACDPAGNCSSTGALTPEHPPADFGCASPV